MKYRSYNSELLIATTLMCDVFNDVIIDRRKHGLDRDYSKAITLKDIVQQKIEVPCILGDRGIILKSLENYQGKYKLPLIIVQMKDIKTDTNRMCDLHADVFYQQDEAFYNLPLTDSKYRPQELSKKRAQPITINYDVTFLTKYKEDLDQIVSNFAVHFRPDIYLKWWHPRNKKAPLTSQLNWSHSVTFDSSIDYDPTKAFVYKGTTSFTFKSWLFYGMHATDNAIDPELESVIKYFKLFPNRTGEDIGEDGEVKADSYDEDSLWTFGNIENEDKGTLAFWGMDSDQEYTGSDEELMKQGHYAMNNIFYKNYSAISGDPIISGIHLNPLVGDFFSKYDQNYINYYNKYQNYIEIDTQNINFGNKAFIKNVYFKGSFPLSSFNEAYPPSGDYMFRKFFTTQMNSYDQEKKSEFGESFTDSSDLNIEYDVNTKNLIFSTLYDSDEYSCYMKSKFNSEAGHFQEFEIKSKPFGDFNDYIAYSFYKEYDTDLINIESGNILNYHNMISISDSYIPFNTKLHIDVTDNKTVLQRIKSCIKGHWNSIDLQEKDENTFYIEFEDSKIGEYLKSKDIYDVPFRSLKLLGTQYIDKYQYQILMNKYIYIILKQAIENEDDCEIFDFGVHFPLTFFTQKALLYEITIKESRELLGLNFYLGI